MTTALVTSAARGIGRAIATRLAADHSRIVIVDVAPNLADTAFDLGDELGVDVVPVQVDLTSLEGLDVVKASVGGRLDLLVNNAGITRDARLVNMSQDDFLDVIDVNLGAAHMLTKTLAPSLVAAGGAVVNIASRAYLGNFGQFNYAMSKGGMVGMTRALAVELAPDVRVNAVAPGLTATDMVTTIPDDVIERMISAIPLGRMGEPEEIAEAVAFLGSARASYVTGQVLVVGGGRSLT